MEALDENQKRLRETERICQELADENHRLGKEIAGWRERFARNEENESQLRLLRRQLETLHEEHARALETNRRMGEVLAENRNTSRVSPAAEDGLADAKTLAGEVAAGYRSDSVAADRMGGAFLVSIRRVLQHGMARATEASQMTWSSLTRDWRISSVCAGLVLLMFTVAIAIKSRRSDGSISGNSMALARQPATVETMPEPISDPRRKAPPHVQGAFQTVRPTAVFTAPSENSALVVSLGKGVRVNVVDSRDGWLEVRSKHGRPPGYIRQNDAERVR